MKTIEVAVSAHGDGSYTATAQAWPIDFGTACDILGVGVGAGNPRTTRNAYRQWLGFAPGQMLTRDEFQELHWMTSFVAKGGGGRYFSRRHYLELRESGQLPQELKRLGIEPHPLTLANP